LNRFDQSPALGFLVRSFSKFFGSITEEILLTINPYIQLDYSVFTTKNKSQTNEL